MFPLTNSDFGAISVTVRSCAAPISKVERHIWDRFCFILWCDVNRTGIHWVRRKYLGKEERGLDFSASNSLGHPMRYDVRCMWMTCSSSRPLLFTLYRLLVPKSYLVKCEHNLNHGCLAVRCIIESNIILIGLSYFFDVSWRFLRSLTSFSGSKWTKEILTGDL